MKKLFTLVLLTFLSAHSFAQSELQCQYHTKKSGFVYTPPFITTGANWIGQLQVVNVSNTPVTVSMEFTDNNGGNYNPVSVTYGANFSAANTPLNGATLEAGARGIITINDSSTQSVSLGKIKWESEDCLPNALYATYLNQYLTANVYDSRYALLNGGNPF